MSALLSAIQNPLFVSFLVLMFLILMGLAYMDRDLRKLNREFEKEIARLNHVMRQFDEEKAPELEIEKAGEFQKQAALNGIPYIELDTAACQLNAAPIEPKKRV